MKKIFSLFAAVLFAGSMMAATTVLSCSEAAAQAANAGDEEYEVTGYVTSIKTAYNPSFGNISFWMADTEDGSEVLQAYRCTPESANELPEVGDKVTVTGKLTMYGSTPEFAQGCTCIIIEKGEGGGSDPLPTEIGNVQTCAEAAQALAGVQEDVQVNGGADFTLRGYVTEIATEYSEQFGNISFWMADTKDGGKVLEAYRCKPESADKLPVVGDYVEVTGKLKRHGSIPEFDANCTCTILDEGQGGGEGGELTDPTNCAEAREAALSVSENNEEYNNGKEYTIEGYVTSIQTAYNAQYNNVSFWMADTKDGGKVLEAYRAVCATAADAPNEGDKVAVTGKLTKYGTTPEFAAGCTFTILERAEVEEPENLGEKTIEEFLALKNTKDTCILTGVVKNIKKNDDGTVNKYGNFDLEDETGTVYVYGLLTAAGEAQKFAEMGIEEYDILTIKAVYNEHNGNPQAKNAVFVSVEKGEKPEPQTIELGVVYGEAALYATQGIWQINLYKDYDSETQTVTYPDLYIGVTPKSATTIAGIYSIEEEIAFVEVDVASEQTVTATEATDLEVVCLGDGVYSFYMEFVGDDGNTYVLDAEVPVLAYNGESEEGEEIELEDNPETGVESTKVADKAVKFIENATLMIERNGVRYNVMGQVVR